jgi:hypothetical protein
MIKEFRLFLVGVLIMGIGGFALASKSMLPGARLPFWPFDGIFALIGGAFITYWSFKVITEPDDDDKAQKDVSSKGE